MRRADSMLHLGCDIVKGIYGRISGVSEADSVESVICPVALITTAHWPDCHVLKWFTQRVTRLKSFGSDQLRYLLRI